jgi:iron complex outermembrane receptor protein
VLSNDPSIVTNTQSGGNYYESTSIRGFSENTYYGSGSLNGLANMSPLNSADMDYIERVEVLRGSSALVNGMTAMGNGGIGGKVNLYTKQAPDEPLTEITTRYTSRAQAGVHLDVGRRFGAEKEFGVRFNGAFRKGDGPVEPQENENGSAALNLDYRGERVRISADLAHQSNEASPMNLQRLSVGTVGVPDAPDVGTSLNPAWTQHLSRSTMAMARGEVDIVDNVTAYAAIGKQRFDHAFSGVANARLLDSSGTYGWTGLQNTHYIIDLMSMQGGLRATATTGPVDHSLSLSLSQSRLDYKSASWSGSYSATTNIYDPVFGSAPTIGGLGDPAKASERNMSGVGFADTMSMLDGRLQFTAGLRYQQVEINNFNSSTGALNTAYKSSAWTPAFGLVVKPLENVSLYANYIQALEAGSIVSASYANAGEVMPPYLGEQYEAGVKVDWGTVTTTLALFQIAKQNSVSVPNPGGGLPTLAADGEQRNRGVELNAYGELTPSVRLLGGVTLLDARLTKTTNGAYDGNRAEGAPTFRAVVGGEWDTPFMEGLTLTGRITHTGGQVVSNTNESLKIPSWTTLDIGARYAFTPSWNKEPIVVRFNVDNVFDKNYWSTASGNYLYLGSPRTLRLSTTLKF